MKLPASSPRPKFDSSSFAFSLLKTIAVGALAGLLSFGCSEFIFSAFDHTGKGGIQQALASSSLWVAINALVQGAILLAWDNFSSLRGKWFRDLAPGVPLFGFLGLAAGAIAQVIYTIGMTMVVVGAVASGAREMTGGVLVAASLIRGIGWAFFGAGIGVSMGVLRSDQKQMIRGAAGGALGGFLGGLGFNFLTFAMAARNPGAPDSLPRAIGLILLGAFVAGALRVVGEVFKSAWLLGISTGPYEGKEYPLGNARVSVGRAGNCDLSLFRDETLAPQLGALVFQNGGWWWQGEAIPINGAMQTSAQLLPGARLQIGKTLFRFNDRSKSAPRDPFAGAPLSPAPYATTSPTPAAPNPAPVPVSWTFSPAIGNSLTGWRFDSNRAGATIGRAEGNDWQLRDDGTSSRHAKIERTFDGIALTDLGSTNGTFVNGQRIAANVPVELRGRETVRIGRTQWTVVRG